jgi:hypothetical protein
MYLLYTFQQYAYRQLAVTYLEVLYENSMWQTEEKHEEPQLV